MKLRKTLPWLFSALIALPTVGAQTMTWEEQASLTAPTVTGETGLFETITGDTLKAGDWSFSIYINNYDYLAAPWPEGRPPSRRSYRDMDIEEDRLTATVGYGFTDRWEVIASLPYVMLDQNAGDLAGFVNGFPMSGKFDESGLGNLHVATKFQLLDPAMSDSRLAMSLFVDLPTGDDDGPIATGNTDWGAGLHWTKGMFSASGIYNIRGDRDEDDFSFRNDFAVSDEIHLDAGVNVPLSFWATTNWITELNSVIYTGGDREPDNAIYLLSGIRHWFGDSGWGLSAALRANVSMWTSDNKSCPIGGLFGLHYKPLHLAPALPPPPPPVVAPPPPPPAPVEPPPPPVAPRQPVQLRTDEILFEPGSARLTNIAKAILDDVALRMKNEPKATALVIGYNDNREQTGANRDLDRRRAEAVRDYLVNRHGIDASRITLEARGTSDPVGDPNTDAGRRQNRRVVIKLMIP